MSLLPQIVYAVPEETARIARAAFPKSNPYLRLADQLGVIYQDGDFAHLFPFTGQPALAPVRLALTTLLQFAEGLSDRQAADAVRGRMAWKYLLCLELTDPGFDASVLCEFRARLIAGGAEELLLTKLLTLCQEMGWLKARGRQRTDSTHILAAVRMLNRLERVGETLRAALNEVAAVAPDWLRARVPAEWYERYARRIENYHLPKSEAARADYAAQVGGGWRSLVGLAGRAGHGPAPARIGPGANLAANLGRTVYDDGAGAALTPGQRDACGRQLTGFALRCRRALEYETGPGMGRG